jgi:hypothetical protein
MYHSTAILLADGSVLVSGSNPNKDVTTVQWGTSYVVEKWYPLWYSNTRPTPSAFPDSLSYGGAAWNLTYTPTNSSSNPGNTKVVVIRTGFSTHCVSGNQSQRRLCLLASYFAMLIQRTDELRPAIPRTGNFVQPRPGFGPGDTLRLADASERQHLPTGSCHDLPRRRRRPIDRTGEWRVASHRVELLADPSQLLTIGSGAIETQTMNAASVLPQSSVVVAPSSSNTTASASTVSGTALSAAKSAALAQRTLPTFPSSMLLGLMILLGAFVWA